MMTLMRTVIDVPEEVIQSLDRMCGIEKRSRAALIRDALAAYLREKAVPSAEAAFGLWKTPPTDGVEYQSDLRDEWQKR